MPIGSGDHLAAASTDRPAGSVATVVAACAGIVAFVQMVLAPMIEGWAAAAWRRRGITGSTLIVDLLDAVRLITPPLAFCAAALWGWTRLRSTTADAALTVPRHRIQALLGAACTVLAYGMFTSVWMPWADPQVAPMSDARGVIAVREAPVRPVSPDELAFSVDTEHGDADGTGAAVRAHPLISLTETSGSGLLLAVTLSVVCVLAPAAEEILFRGLLFSAIRRRIGAVSAGVVSTVLFTLVHVPIVRAAALVPIAALGAVLCVLTWRNASVVPAVIAHVTINALTMAQAVSHNTAVPQAVGVVLVPASLVASLMVVVWMAARVDRRSLSFA